MCVCIYIYIYIYTSILYTYINFEYFREYKNREKIRCLKIAKINHAKFKPFFRNFEKPFGTLCFSKAKKGGKYNKTML